MAVGRIVPGFPCDVAREAVTGDDEHPGGGIMGPAVFPATVGGAGGVGGVGAGGAVLATGGFGWEWFCVGRPAGFAAGGGGSGVVGAEAPAPLTSNPPDTDLQ